MKNNHVIGFIIISLLLSCTNGERSSEKKNVDSPIVIRANTEDAVPDKKQTEKIDTANYEYKYIFFNDSINYTLYIKKGSMSKKYQVPEKLEFKLILSDKLGTYPDKRFEGVAVLTSASESFSEKKDIKEGDYFAADYIFNIKDCSLKIRLDIERYAACVVSTTCIDIKEYFNEYPDYDVMKRVSYPK